MTVPIERKSFSVEQYYQMAEVGIIKDTDKVELINGDIIDRSPINSEHAGVVILLHRIIYDQIGQGTIVAVQSPVRLDDKSEPEPDIYLAKTNDNFYRIAHPTAKDIHLIIEVADSSLDKDREIKLPLYARHNISEYWIVNLKDQQIEVYRDPKKGRYNFTQIFTSEGIIEMPALKFSINFKDTFPKA